MTNDPIIQCCEDFMCIYCRVCYQEFNTTFKVCYVGSKLPYLYSFYLVSLCKQTSMIVGILKSSSYICNWSDTSHVKTCIEQGNDAKINFYLFVYELTTYSDLNSGLNSLNFVSSFNWRKQSKHTLNSITESYCTN